eukprot:548251_1
MSSKLADILESTYSDLLHAAKGKTEIILVRHGKTHWNTERIWQGQQDSNLTHIGISGAINVGIKLYKLHTYDGKIHAIYSSPLGRAKHTAQLIMQQFTHKNDKLDIEYDDRLMERNLGNLQGLSIAKFQTEHPEQYEELHHNLNYKPPGKNSETRIDILNRASEFLAEIVSKYHGKRILVVAHGGVIQAIMNDIISHNKVGRTFHVKNCAINIIQRDSSNGRWYVSVLGDDDYGNLKQVIQVKEHKTNHLPYLIIGFALGCAMTAFVFKRLQSTFS